MLLNVNLKHGSTKYPLTIDDGSLLSDLMAEVEALTGVPASGQKLILNGRTLTSLDHGKTLSDCRVTNNSKVMVLGKRFDPHADEAYRRVQEIDSKSREVDKRLSAADEEVRGIADGYLASEHHRQALKGLAKRARCASEEYMRLLEALDSLATDETQAAARNKRKSVVDAINASLDKADRLIAKVEAMLKDLPGQS